jgi:hypothetical protein
VFRIPGERGILERVEQPQLLVEQEGAVQAAHTIRGVPWLATHGQIAVPAPGGHLVDGTLMLSGNGDGMRCFQRIQRMLCSVTERPLAVSHPGLVEVLGEPGVGMGRAKLSQDRDDRIGAGAARRWGRRTGSWSLAPERQWMPTRSSGCSGWEVSVTSPAADSFQELQGDPHG